MGEAERSVKGKVRASWENGTKWAKSGLRNSCLEKLDWRWAGGGALSTKAAYLPILPGPTEPGWIWKLSQIILSVIVAVNPICPVLIENSWLEHTIKTHVLPDLPISIVPDGMVLSVERS